MLLADTIVMFSPLVRRELANDPVIGWAAQKCVLAPLPPNIEAPAGTADSELRQQLAAAREGGRLVIGHFGSIYPGKQPNALLDICAILKERGLKPLTVYIGSFIKGVDTVEEDFYARASELGISEDVVVSGYVASDQRGVRTLQRDRRFLLPARGRPHGAAFQHSRQRAVRPTRDRHRPHRSWTSSTIIRASRS